MLNQEWIRETQITFFLAASGVELDCCLFLRRSLTEADGGCGAWLEDAGSPLSSIATGANNVIQLRHQAQRKRCDVARNEARVPFPPFSSFPVQFLQINGGNLPRPSTDSGTVHRRGEEETEQQTRLNGPPARSLNRLSFTLISFSLNKILVNLTLERKSLHEFTSDEQYHSTLG